MLLVASITAKDPHCIVSSTCSMGFGTLSCAVLCVIDFHSSCYWLRVGRGDGMWMTENIL